MQAKKNPRKKNVINLPSKIGTAALALLFGLVGRGSSTIIELIELGDTKMGMGGAIAKGLNKKSFWDYYKELEELKENSARTILWRLQKKGLVDKRENQYFLTRLGSRFIKIFQEKNLEKQWDGKWRIVMFDIPEKMRKERNWLRFQLSNSKYKSLQESVYIGKYPLEEVLFEEIINRNLRHFIRLITLGEIDDESVLST